MAEALSAMTNTEIVTKDEYYARETRARSGVGQGYVFKGSLDVPRAIELTHLLIQEKKPSSGFWGKVALATGAVVGAAAGVTGAALVVVTAPVSVPILAGTAAVVGGGAVGAAAGATATVAGTVGAKMLKNARSAVQLLISSSDGKQSFLAMSSEQDTILQLKLRIRGVFGIEPEDQCLSFHGILLDDTYTLAHYSIANISTIKLSVRGKPVELFYLDDKYVDSRWDRDFTNIDNGGTKFMRGGHRYHKPYGWKRMGIKVLGKYPGGEAWLGSSGSTGEWAVTYHGTHEGAFNGICKEGIKIGHRNAYGRGVYSASHIEIAEGYAKKFSLGGIVYKGVFQNRVNPNDMIIPGGQPDYRICPNEASIRPYGLCVKKV